MISRRVAAALAQFLKFRREQVRHPQAARKFLSDDPARCAPGAQVHFLQ
jgi:hypothetical protein